MTCGRLFQPNTDVMKRIGEIQKKYSVVDVEKINNIHPIDPILKVCTLQLIKHELHRYDSNKYSQMENIDSYTEGLFHFMCIKKTLLQIDWTLMSIETIFDAKISFKCGYNGFLFLKSLFFKNDMEMVDLELILLLFPNVSLILLIMNSVMVSKDCFDYVLGFLKEDNCKKLETLAFECKLDNNWLISKYKNEFQSVGWDFTEEQRLPISSSNSSSS
eukprot:324995_1